MYPTLITSLENKFNLTIIIWVIIKKNKQTNFLWINFEKTCLKCRNWCVLIYLDQNNCQILKPRPIEILKLWAGIFKI